MKSVGASGYDEVDLDLDLDLNGLDFFLWGHLKTLLFTTPAHNADDFRNGIVDAFKQL